MATTQNRAKIGGETGTNGEFYEGGKFLPSTEKPKRDGSRPRRARKVEVEPFVWVTLEPGDDRRPLLSVVGTGAAWIDRRDWSKGIAPFAPAFEAYGDRMYNGETLAEVQAQCDRWNAGERWYA